MKYKNVLYTAAISTLCLGITSCSDFLDEMPDNRTELTTEESITKVLVSAYPMTTNCHIGEFYSDNIDENSKAYSYLFRLNEHLYRWQQTTEENQDSPHGMIVITRLHRPTKPWQPSSKWETLNHCQHKEVKLYYVAHIIISY